MHTPDIFYVVCFAALFAAGFICGRVTKADLNDAKNDVVEAAACFVKSTKTDMDELEGSESMDIPVEFMNLHDAVRALGKV